MRTSPQVDRKVALNQPIGLRACIRFLVLFAAPMLLDARLGPGWTFQQMFDRSDLVVIATFASTKDTNERSVLTDLEPPIKVIGVTTEFKAQLVLKGEKDIATFRLHHYRFQDPNDALLANTAQLIKLPTAPHNGIQYVGHQTFLMFLVKERDGRYAPATGQTDPATFSIRDLTP